MKLFLENLRRRKCLGFVVKIFLKKKKFTIQSTDLITKIDYLILATMYEKMISDTGTKSKTSLSQTHFTKVQILFHMHTSAKFGWCCLWIVLTDSPPMPPPALPISLSLPPIHSPIFVPWSTTEPVGGGLMLAGREHHLLFFSKTEQLVHTELDWTGHAGPTWSCGMAYR